MTGYGELADGGWGGGLSFPRIQGADCFGEVIAVGEEVEPGRIGERVLTRTMQSAPDLGPMASRTMGSEFDGAFAQYVAVESRHALAVRADLTDAELGDVPCAFTTAENMLLRVGVAADTTERLLITGASGGVGLAAVQLAALRGAHVTAMTTADKADAVRAAGASDIIGRDDPIEAGAYDMVVDLVAGPRWGELLEGLRVGGRFVTAGAIAGPIVELDVRTLYLHDLTLLGSTYQGDEVLESVIGYLESGRLRPIVAATYPLAELPAAQEAFLAKRHVGKIAILVA